MRVCAFVFFPIIICGIHNEELLYYYFTSFFSSAIIHLDIFILGVSLKGAVVYFYSLWAGQG